MLLTEQLIENLNNGTVVVSDVGATIPGINTTEDKLQFLYEACSASVKGELSTAKVPIAIKAVGVDAEGHWARQNLAQVIWLLAQETSDQEEQCTKLKDLVQDLQKASLVGKTELHEVAPAHFLVSLGVLPQGQETKKREGQVNGSLFYKLNKFNALREENEGFSKMIVCLHSFGAAAAASQDNIPQILMEIRSLIGYFDLDPNRVAALVLDVFQDQWDNLAYLQLLPLFSAQAVSASLAFIYAFYKKEGEVAPDNLYRMSVQLIKAKAVTLNGLWVHLSPEDATLKELQQAAQASALNAYRSRNNLNKDIDQIELNTSDFGISAEKFQLNPRELLTTALQPLWAENQKLELARIAFEMEELDLAWQIYGALKATGMEPADYPPINAWMASQVLAGLDPATRTWHDWQPEAEEVPLPVIQPEAEQMLDRMGLSFSASNELWVRLVRHWKQFLMHHQHHSQKADEAEDPTEAAVAKVCDELVRRIFPGLALMSPNPFLAAELWLLLELLPYSRRFALYKDVSALLGSADMGSLDLVCLKAGADSVYRLAKRIAGRMTFDKDPDRIETAANKKEKDKQTKGLIRNLAKVSHSNPVTVAEYLVSYAQNNGTHIESLTDAMGDLPDIVLDAITFRVIRTFTVSKTRYKPDNVLVSDPLANASRFVALVARKLTRDGKNQSGAGIDLHALLQLVYNAGLKSHNEVFVLLGDLMDIVAGVHVLEDVGDTELLALAGGEILRTVKIINKEVRLASRIARAGADRLIHALTMTECGFPLAVPLFVLLAQNRSLRIIGQDRGVGSVEARLKPEDRIRVVSDRYDHANRTLLQYADFLKFAIDKSKYQQMMPPLASLLSPDKFGLEPEIAFLLYRPVLSRVPFPKPPTPKDEEDGEIPDGMEVAPMEVEEDTAFGEVRWSHLVEAVDAVLPADKKGLTKPFYLLFWRLTYADICNAGPEYDKQIKLLQREQAEALQEHTACGEPPQIERGYMRPNLKFIENSDDRKLAQKHWIRKHEALKDQVKLLEREKAKVEERWRDSRKLFRQWKDHLLADADHKETIPVFISHCLLPRCILTPEDAMYCAAFIRHLALEDTPYFSFMRCCQMLVPIGLTLLFTMTEREADNFGIFFREVLRCIQVWWLNQDDLERMLPRQGFRMDAIFFVGAGKQATKHNYNEFARGLQSDVANKLVAIFKANEKANTNLRAAVNAMLVLNKTKTVFPMILQHAKSLTPPLRSIYTRLQPPQDSHGNFTEQPVPLFNLAIRCHNDLNNTIQSNVKFDSGTSTAVPAIRLFERQKWDPQYASRPTPKDTKPPPQGRPPSAAPLPVAPAAAASRLAASSAPAKAASTAAAAEGASATSSAAGKTANGAAGAPKSSKEGTVRASANGRTAKEPAAQTAPAHRGSKDAAALDSTDHRRESKEPAGREAAARSSHREPASRGVRENGERGVSRDSSRTTSAASKAADDKQLPDLRAAALKSQAAEGARKGGSPPGQKAAVDGKAAPSDGKGATPNGTAPASGNKRRADPAAADPRGTKAAKTDAAAAPQAEAARASTSTPRPTTRSAAAAAAGNQTQLRADAAEFTPSAKADSAAAADKPSRADPEQSARAVADKPSGAASGKSQKATSEQASGAAAGTPSGADAKQPSERPEQTARAGKRAREGEQEGRAAGDQAQGSREAGEEQEPKRPKRKPISWNPIKAEAPAVSAVEIIASRTSGSRQEDRSSSKPDEPRRTSRDNPKPSDSRHEPRDAKIREDERQRTRSDVSQADEAKHPQHAQRDSHRDESERRHTTRESQRSESDRRHAVRAEPEAKHAERDSHRRHESTREAGHRDSRSAAPTDAEKSQERNSDARRTDRKPSASRSGERKAAEAKPAVPEEQEDGEVEAAGAAAEPQPAGTTAAQNGVEAAGPSHAPAEASLASPQKSAASLQPGSPEGQDAKDDSDGKESKKGHKRKREHRDKEHKKKDKKEKKEKKDKDPDKEKAKAEKKAEKARAAAAASDAAAQPDSAAAPARPDSSAEAAAVAAPSAAVPASRLASSIARSGNRAVADAAPGLGPRPNLDSSDPSQGPSASTQAPSKGADREQRDSPTDGTDRPAAATEGLAPGDLRLILNRNKSNSDQNAVPARAPEPPMPATRQNATRGRDNLDQRGTTDRAREQEVPSSQQNVTRNRGNPERIVSIDRAEEPQMPVRRQTSRTRLPQAPYHHSSPPESRTQSDRNYRSAPHRGR